MVANLAQSLDMVEASIGDLVDLALHGQLAVQVDTEVPDDSIARTRLHRLQTHGLELIENRDGRN